MRAHAFIALLIAALAGCSSTAPYGNFVKNSPAAYDQKLADDTVAQLIAVYPPAITRFTLQQGTPDAFGTALVAMLRTKGYAIMEFQTAPAPNPQASASSLGSAAEASRIMGPMPTTLALGYVMDLLPDANLYRVTVLVGKQTLTRAYLTQNGSLYPAGAWVRRE